MCSYCVVILAIVVFSVVFRYLGIHCCVLMLVIRLCACYVDVLFVVLFHAELCCIALQSFAVFCFSFAGFVFFLSTSISALVL